MKILIVGCGKTHGGIESFVRNYYIQLIKFDDIEKIDITTYDDDLAFKDEYNHKKTDIFYTGNFMHFHRYSKILYNIMKKGQYDVVHYNMNSAVNLLPLKIAKKLKIKKIIAHAHNSSSDKGLLKAILHNIQRSKIKKYANILLSCSDVASNWFFKNKKAIVIPNAIDYDKYGYSANFRDLIRRKFEIKNEIVIGNVSRFNPQKNHEFMIRLIKQLPDNYKLILIGSGPLRENVEKKINEMKLSNKVIILNEMDDIYKFYSAMDIFILPSLYEGLPYVGVEAQANGLNCIFSDKITKDLTISSNAYYLSINDITLWINMIENLNIERIKILNDKFDIKSCSDILHNIYAK